MDCGESISKHHQTMAYPRFLLQNVVHLIFLFLKGFNRVPKENWKQESVRRIINSGHTCALTFLFDTRSIILSRLKILWQISFLTPYFSASEAEVWANFLLVLEYFSASEAEAWPKLGKFPLWHKFLDLNTIVAYFSGLEMLKLIPVSNLLFLASTGCFFLLVPPSKVKVWKT